MAVDSQRQNDARYRPLQDRCAFCETSQGTLSRCGACRLVKYCCNEHRIKHRNQHQAACRMTIKLRDRLKYEKNLVRYATADPMTPANAFETHVGHFWSLVHTRDYMRARWALADHAIQMATLDGVLEGFGHFQDMIRLCRTDDMGIGNNLPVLMLRLDQDQQSYDFIKWFATTNKNDVSLHPFLDTRGADVLEDPKHLMKGHTPLSHQIAALLLKMKMLNDIRQIMITRKVLKNRLPAHLSRMVAGMVLHSPLSSRFLEKTNLRLTGVEKRLMSHCTRIGAAISKANEHFVFELLEATPKMLSYRPMISSRGSREEVAWALHSTYATWQETAGALNLLKDARACAARDSEDEVAVFLDHCKDGRTPEEMLADLSINRIWGYLDFAVANSSYLGPPAERPSERWTRQSRELWQRHLPRMKPQMRI